MSLDLNLCRYDPVAFIDRYITRNELGQPFGLFPHQREILRAAFAFDADGRLPWDTIVYSATKKSGKTTINGAVGLWWGFTQEAPNEIELCANDLEQSTSRTFKTITGLLKYNPELGASAECLAKQITVSNDTVYTPRANDYAGGAGGNPGLTSWTELWAYTSEASRRLWEELTPVPTRRNSIRFVDTYSGFEGESVLLFDLYKLGVGKDEHPDGQGERIHPTLPIYANRDARVFVYWDHEPRMPWQTAQYLAAQKRTLRPNTYLRLHENRWTTSTSTFIEGPLWDGCVDASLSPWLADPDGRRIYLGLDAATKIDCSAVVGVTWDDDGKLQLVLHRIWRPLPGEPVDLEATVEQYIRDMHARFPIRVSFDPYQLARSSATLQAAGVDIRELPQTVGNTTAMGQALWDVLTGKNLRMYPAADLREQALATVAVETPRGFRIAKEKTSRKIDGIAALSMAVLAAIEAGPTRFIHVSGGDMDTVNETVDEAEARRAEELRIATEDSAREIAAACARDGFWGFNS